MRAPLTHRLSRRQFLKAAGAATAAAVLPVGGAPLLARRPKVMIGAISYSFRQIPGSAEEILSYMQQLELPVIELMGTPAEVFAGAPAGPARPRSFRDMPPEERREFSEARQAHGKEMQRWRAGASMDRFAKLGSMYRDGGVDIDILKLGRPGWSDAEIDYAFNAARAMGARGISFEISNEAAERMGPFATRHDIAASMHNHTQVANEGFSWDIPLSFSAQNMLNLDIGHYVAGLGRSPVPLIKRYHDRITHLHLKDRRTPENGRNNVPWGDGDTPIGEVLHLVRDNGYPITAMIELEYEIPEGSTVMAEMQRCADFCRAALG